MELPTSLSTRGQPGPTRRFVLRGEGMGLDTGGRRGGRALREQVGPEQIWFAGRTSWSGDGRRSFVAHRVSQPQEHLNAYVRFFCEPQTRTGRSGQPPQAPEETPSRAREP